MNVGEESLIKFLGDFVFRVVRKCVEAYERAAQRRLKASLAACGEDVYLGQNVIIWGVDDVRIGNNVGIHSLTHIFGAGGVTIGSRVYISANCSIASITHSLEVSTRETGIHKAVVIEDDTWLGTGAIVLPGVRIGRGSIIGAGSVVTRDIPPMSIAYGVPAKVFGQVPEENGQDVV